MFARTPGAASRNTTQMSDAAFRDGAFVAQLDAQNGRKPHLMSGRWSANADRASFIVGYEQAYEEMSQSHKGSFPRATTAEAAGFADGMADAASDQASSHAFQPVKTKNYLHAGNVSTQNNEVLANFQQEYRQAYANGYQQRYFLNQDGSLWAYYAQ
jgi:hypothetical protein